MTERPNWWVTTIGELTDTHEDTCSILHSNPGSRHAHVCITTVFYYRLYLKETEVVPVINWAPHHGRRMGRWRYSSTCYYRQ